MKTGIFLTLVMGLLAAHAAAEVQFVNPTRSLLADNNQGSAVNQTDMTFNDFNDRLTTSWVITKAGVRAPAWANPYKTGDYFSSVFQDSVINSGKIYAKGFAEEWNPFYHTLPQSYLQSSVTTFSVDLVVNAVSTVNLSGTLNAWGDTGGTELGHYYTQIKLFSASETIYTAGMDSYQNYGGWWESDRIEINESIVLNPGLYSFYAVAYSLGQYDACGPNEGIGGGGYSYFDVQLIPEPASVMFMLAGAVWMGARRRR